MAFSPIELNDETSPPPALGPRWPRACLQRAQEGSLGLGAVPAIPQPRPSADFRTQRIPNGGLAKQEWRNFYRPSWRDPLSPLSEGYWSCKARPIESPTFGRSPGLRESFQVVGSLIPHSSSKNLPILAFSP